MSYFIGSIPSGFLISKWSKGIDIRTLGRKQTGGTAVFKSAGKWQAAVVGIFDIFKGWLVVWAAQRLSFGLEAQIFSGLAAVAGHNWPIFLKFFGGRGVATLLGATFALSSNIFGLAIIPFIILTLLWDGAIATLLFLAVLFYLSLHFGQFASVGLFGVLVLPIILIKRLTGVKQELPLAKSKKRLILNRLFLDRSEEGRPFPRWKKSL